MDYAGKVASVTSAYQVVETALSMLTGIKYELMDSRNIAVISVWNTTTNKFDKEALLNIYWHADKEAPAYTLSTYPHSNVPFDVKKGPLDYDDDGTIEIEDIVVIATDLFVKLNE